MASKVAVGIDIGGTNLKGATVDGEGSILSHEVRPALAERGADALVSDIVELFDALVARASLTRSDVVGVGVGSPGPLSVREGRIIDAANLPGWSDIPLRDLLRERLGVKVVLDNDGNAAAYGEYWVGAGEEADSLVMLTLGTGVGAGVVVNGRLLHGHFENAGELGHMIIAPGGLPCSCGQRGCLEQYSSARSVAARVVAAVRSGEECALASEISSGEEIDATMVEQCARDGDALCTRIWDDTCFYLAVACVNIQHAYNPACIVLGGGMSRAGDFLLDKVAAHFTRQRWSLHEDIPTITLGKLGYDAGIIGAAGLAWLDDS
jgi:glucokinase